MLVDCPTCKRRIEWTPEAEFRPFCSKKCQLIDLGDWATEAHTIPCDNSQAGLSPVLDEEAIAEQYEQQSQSFFKSP